MSLSLLRRINPSCETFSRTDCHQRRVSRVTLSGVEKIELTCRIEKTAPEQRRWYGKAYIHTDGEGRQIVDHSGDVIDTPETQAALEDAFYEFVKSYRSGDMEHQVFGAATMIEGIIVTKEKKAAGLFPPGMDEGIYLGFEANDSPEGEVLWDGIKSGRLSAMSIVGEGRNI